MIFRIAVLAAGLLLAGHVARADALEDKAEACLDPDKPAAELICLSDLVVKNPKSAVLLDYRALSYFSNNQHDLAIADLQRALTLEPENPDYYAALGYVYQDYGKYELAIFNLSRAIELTPDVRYFQARAECFKAAGKASQGLADANAVIELATKDEAENFVLRGEILEAMGESDRAVADFHKALSIDGDSFEAQAGLDRLSAGSTASVDATYELRLCNKSGEDMIYAAVAVFDDIEDEDWTIHAWYSVANGECRTVATRSFGSYKTIEVAIYAESDDRIWSSAEASLCVDPENAYTRKNTAGYTCQGNEKLYDFFKASIEKDGPTTVFTQNFNP